VADINLDAHNDGVRMTWPRAAVLSIALLIGGGTWASVGFQLEAMRREQADFRLEVKDLRHEVRELREAYLLSTPVPPRVDAKGRLLR